MKSLQTSLEKSDYSNQALPGNKQASKFCAISIISKGLTISEAKDRTKWRRIVGE